MTVAAVALVLCLLVAVGLFVAWRSAIAAHTRRIEQLDVRVHVNGIRGKSTVTRLVAGVLREGGFVTVAKTTGSAARVIDPTGAETAIARRGAATINEQVDVVASSVGPEVEALVVECMAVRPMYQRYSQDHMVRSDITIITNVRLDHQEEMGETLEEIADSLALTTPVNGVLVTAEERPDLRERLAQRAAERGSRFVFADPASVDDEDMRGFDYLQFRENIAVGLEVARLLGISREAAIAGMWKSVPDVGVVRLRSYDVRGTRVLWVPLFAANDRESVVLTFDNLAPVFPPGAVVVGVLNNRRDRGRRAELFAQIVPEDLSDHLDHVITFGAYEDQVIKAMEERGYGAERVHRMGETVDPSLDQILDLIAGFAPGGDVVLVGMVNIHTHQAELLIEHFAHLDGDAVVDEFAESRSATRASAGRLRGLRAATRFSLVPAEERDA